MFALDVSVVWEPAANCSAVGRVPGVFEVIVGAMRRHEGVASVQQQACRVLATLAHDNGAWWTGRSMAALQAS